MDVWIALQRGPGGDAALESLMDWLRLSPELSGRLRRVRRPAAENEMGLATEAIVAAVGSGGVATVLASALRSWLSHPRRSDITISIKSGDGDAVYIDAKRVSGSDIESLLGQAFAEQRDQEGPLE